MIRQIAAGVLLGNTLFALLAWAVLSMMADSRQAKINAVQASAELRALQDQERDSGIIANTQ